MGINENLDNINREIKKKVKLVAVSKTKPVSEIMKAYEAGHKIFGENKAQELISKHPELPRDIEWHFIGHMQTNKVKYIAPFVSLIHSVDSLKLLKEINKQALIADRTIDCLLQFHIASEATKFGLDYEEAEEILKSKEFQELQSIRVCGVMGMATFTDHTDIVRQEFKRLKAIFEQLKTNFFQNKTYFNEISMGMSDDYKIAIEEGSTIIRIGSAIFGERKYLHL